jgi:Xaa-Pro dipeptidase
VLDLPRARSAIRGENLAGWLFYNVWHRDEIADLVLGVRPDRKNSRPWVCVVTPGRDTVKIVHRIEASILDHVPGDTLHYYTREEFRAALRRALPTGGPIGADYSPGIPVGSFLDHGTALLLESLDVRLAPSDGLVARYLGAVDDLGRASHDAAAAVLFAAVSTAWDRVAAHAAAGVTRTEGEVSGWMADTIGLAQMESDAPPVVGAGIHTADPHFGPEGVGAPLRDGEVIQFDVWARSRTPGSVYADISWVGIMAEAPTRAQAEVWAAVRDAREAAIALLQARLAAGRPVTGAEADRAAREVIVARGFERGLRHRTGHSIGGRVHGFGVNLDSVEFPDERSLQDGACFSVEPGIYLEGFGMRTEVDCIIHQGTLHVTGGERQQELLTLGERHVRRS